MLRFELNGKQLWLNTDTRVRMVWRNPACNFDEFPGDVGLGIEIPHNDHNRAMLGNPERFEKNTTRSLREFPGFKVSYGGVRLMEGTLVIQEASRKTYKGWLRSSVGNLGKEHREKFIYEVYPFNQEEYFENKANYDPDTDEYACPQVFNPDFFKDKGRKVEVTRKVDNPDYYPNGPEPQQIEDDIEVEAFSEAFRKTASYVVNYADVDGKVKVSVSTSNPGSVELNFDVYVVSPMLFLNVVIEKLLADAKLFVDANCIADDADLKKLILYNNYDITTMEAIMGFELHVIDWVTGGGNTQNYIRPVENYARHYDGPFLYRNLLPKTKLKDFIMGVQNLLNVCLFFKNGYKVDILDREVIIGTSPYSLEKYMVGNWVLGEKKDNTLKFMFTHDDDDTGFQERWEDIDDRRIDEKDPVDDWTDLDNIGNPELGEVRYLRNHNIYVHYALIQREEEDPNTGDMIQTDSIGWQHLALGFQNGYFNRDKEEEEEIETVFSTLFGGQLAFASQKGNIQAMKYAYSNFTPRLLFYLGNNEGKFETENISLDWEKEDTGLLHTRWPKWNRFWSNRLPVEGRANLPLNVLDYVLRNIPYPFRSREGKFLIEEMSVEFGINYIGEAKIKAYKDAYIPNTYSMNRVWDLDDMVLDDELLSGDGAEQYYPLVLS